MAEIAMIDRTLADKAQLENQLYNRIDRSWMHVVQIAKESKLILPFEGKYCIEVSDNHVLIQGYKGRMIINRITFNKTYRLVEPIIMDNFEINGYFDRRGMFQGLVTSTAFGFHYNGMSACGQTLICTGEVAGRKVSSMEVLSEYCQEVINAMRTIYVASVGSIHLPSCEYYNNLRKLVRSGRNTQDVVDELVKRTKNGLSRLL